MLDEEETKLYREVVNKLYEGLNYISQYEKLSPREGTIKLINYQEQEFGIEIYAPHLIPNSVSYSWTDQTLEVALAICLNDLTTWVQIEKEAPKDKFWLDN